VANAEDFVLTQGLKRAGLDRRHGHRLTKRIEDLDGIALFSARGV